MNVIGIDPGQQGGIAYITDHHAEAVPMPLSGKEINGHEVAEILKTKAIELVVVEKVHSMPKQGVASTFKFGMGYGMILGVLEALKLPYRMVTPQGWKGLILAGTAKDKDAAVNFVRRAYPGIDLTPGAKRVPHDGMADALCIAEWGRRMR